MNSGVEGGHDLPPVGDTRSAEDKTEISPIYDISPQDDVFAFSVEMSEVEL